MRFGEIETQIRYMIKDSIDPTNDDPDATQRYPSNVIMHWWNEGQWRMATMRPIKQSLHIAATKWGELANGLVLPSDLYRLKRVQVGRETFLPIYTYEQAMWLERESGCYVADNVLYFMPGSQFLKFIIFYESYYPNVIDHMSELKVPIWALEALEVYCSMKMCEKEMAGDARYRKFITKVDAGVPINNPFIPTANYFWNRFRDIINSHVDDADEAL